MTPVVIDASAGVELAADTLRGRALRALLPADAVPWVPELFYVECGAVLRRWDLNGILTPAQVSQAIGELMAWPLRITQLRGLLPTPGGYGRTSRSRMPSTSLSQFTSTLSCSPTTSDSRTLQACRCVFSTCRSGGHAPYRAAPATKAATM